MMFTMTEDLHGAFERILSDLLVRAEAEAVFLCDRGGNIIAQSSANTYSREDNMAALAAGSFFATRELARLLGESEFHCVFHQGETNSVYMQQTTFDLLMLVVFGKESNPGLVRLYATEGGRAIDKLMLTTEAAAPQQSNRPQHAFEIDPTKQPFSRASGMSAR